MDNQDPNLQQPNQTTQADQAVPTTETPQEHPVQDQAMSEQTPHTDQAAPQEAAPSENVSPESQTPPPPPVIPTQPAAPTAPVVEKKSNSLVLVAGILITLIAVLGVLYFIILKQSSSPATTSVPVKTQTAVKPTTPPVTPTVTPTDDQILNSQVPDPSQDATQLNQDAQGL